MADLSPAELYKAFFETEPGVCDHGTYVGEPYKGDFSCIDVDGPVNFVALAAWLNAKSYRTERDAEAQRRADYREEQKFFNQG